MVYVFVVDYCKDYQGYYREEQQELESGVHVLKKLGIEIPLIGIAKHPDLIVVLAKGATKTYKFSLHNEGFKLIQQLRDESHRFAKKYHKLLRGKKFIGIIKP